jgi:hypothetical protein
VRRKLLMLTVALVMAALALVAVPAFASPVGPGSNSFAPSFQVKGQNFGHCQSQLARVLPSFANEFAQEANPAIFTKGNEASGASFCVKP